MSIGGNPPSNHPRLMTHLKKLRRRGGECIVINPVVETGLVNFKVPSDPTSLLFGTKIASLYVQPHFGGDLALLTGVAKEVLEFRSDCLADSKEKVAISEEIDDEFQGLFATCSARHEQSPGWQG